MHIRNLHWLELNLNVSSFLFHVLHILINNPVSVSSKSSSHGSWQNVFNFHSLKEPNYGLMVDFLPIPLAEEFFFCVLGIA